MRITALSIFNFSAFLKSQVFLLPVLYLFYLSNGLTAADYFLFQGMIVLVNVLLQIPAGLIGDRFSRKFLIVASYVLFLGRIVLWYFFSGGWIVLLGELLYAVSKGLFDAVESPYIYDLLQHKNKTHKMVRAYSKLNFALCAGTGVAALVGAWLYDTLGLQVLLITEFVIVSAAVVMAARLPNVAIVSKKAKTTHKAPLKKQTKDMFRLMALFFRMPQYRPFILYSAALVACSHFFFWSFQPLMKAAGVPIVLFGVVIFINNGMRSLCSLYTEKVLRHISLKTLGIICFVLNAPGLFGGFFLGREGFAGTTVCLLFLFYLCCCIVTQLMFTIAHISRLQRITPTVIRARAAATNMMTARLVTAIGLILPKYLSGLLPLTAVYALYGALFVVLGAPVLRRLSIKQ